MDRGVVDQQLRALGENERWWDLRELRDLPAVLLADERILAISRGYVGRIRLVRRKRLIVVTNTRVIALRSARGAGWRQIELRADDILRVAVRVGPLKGRVLVYTSAGKYSFLVPRAEAYKLEAAIVSSAPPRQIVSGLSPTRVARRVIDHVLALPAAAFNPYDEPVKPAAPAALPKPERTEADERVEAMEEQVAELKRHIEFLEELLRERQGTSVLQ